jgi:hypothetical protein
MAKIAVVINAMELSDLQPTAPEPPEPEPEPELTKLKIETIAKKLQQPWLYGDALHRFAKREGVTLKQMRRIRRAINLRLQAEAAAAVVEE